MSGKFHDRPVGGTTLSDHLTVFFRQFGQAMPQGYSALAIALFRLRHGGELRQ